MTRLAAPAAGTDIGVRARAPQISQALADTLLAFVGYHTLQSAAIRGRRRTELLAVEQFLRTFVAVQRLRCWVGQYGGPGGDSTFDCHIDATLEEGLQIQSPICSLAIDQAYRNKEFVGP